MPIYVQLATSTRLDPRIAPLSDRAFRAYIDALCVWKEGQLDGVLPAAIVEDSRRLRTSLDELVAAGVIVPCAGGYAVLSIQPQTTRAQDEAASEAKRERNQAGGRARAVAANRQALGRFASGASSLVQPSTSLAAPAQIRSEQIRSKQSDKDVRERTASEKAESMALGMRLALERNQRENASK